jgi:nitroimidazol reductase NimA-like FMN-containing flavoprotein (pyridoxamine 5'-phosphate oxidase superfamily)
MSDHVQPTPSSTELTRAECLSLLATGAIGRVVVTIGAQSRSVIRPVNYVFDAVSQSVVFRSTPGGKLYALLHSTSACFEADDIDVAARTGWSVIIMGVTEPVRDAMELRRLGRLALHSWVAGPDAELIRIRARTVSGRRISVATPD